MINARRIRPVLLSGGMGARLWPMSREAMPKQFQAFVGARTLIQESALRVADPLRFGRLMVIANVEQRFLVAEQLREAGIRDPQIVLEPVGRNTAPAVAVAALLALRDDSDALLLVAPSDHVISDQEAFLATVDRASGAAGMGSLTMFGITPTAPATGYGYIRMGPALPEMAGVHSAAAFVEKPDAATAASFLETRSYVWNSGIFLFPARRFLDELERYEPAVLAACREAVERAVEDADFCASMALPSEAHLRSRSTMPSWSGRWPPPCCLPISAGRMSVRGRLCGKSQPRTATAM